MTLQNVDIKQGHNPSKNKVNELKVEFHSAKSGLFPPPCSVSGDPLS